jgi:dihydrofolate reductase
LIVAISDNGVIGREQDLPWRLSTDLRRFKRLTMGHHLLMGRKTFESIGRPLPGRSMVAISRGAPALPEGVALAGSLEEALELARQAGDDEVFVAGGAEIFRLSLPLVDRIYLTRVHAEVEGDVQLPGLAAEFEDPRVWRLVEQEQLTAGELDQYATTFEIWERQGTGPSEQKEDS